MCCAMLILLQGMIEEDKGQLSKAPLHVKQDNDSIEQSTATALNITYITYIPYVIRTYSRTVGVCVLHELYLSCY